MLSFLTCSGIFLPSHDFSLCIFKIALLSLSFMLMAIHACIPAFAWPNTERPKMWAAALKVQQPLKNLSQNLQTAIFEPPFLGSDEFETVKYCQMYYDELSVSLIQPSASPISRSNPPPRPLALPFSHGTHGVRAPTCAKRRRCACGYGGHGAASRWKHCDVVVSIGRPPRAQ